MYNISGVGCPFNFRWLVVIMLTDIMVLMLVTMVRIEPRSLWMLTINAIYCSSNSQILKSVNKMYLRQWAISNIISVYRQYWDMVPESQNSLLLGNSSVNTFPWKQMCTAIEDQCFLWSAPLSLLRNSAGNTSLQ
jgi:hypothetical protein